MYQVGDLIAGYRVLEVLGHGGMGEVYKATHPRLPRADAIKVLRSAHGADPVFRARFEREADVVAPLNHPNIVAVLDRGVVGDRLWIAMELVPGTDAGRLLEGHGALDPRLAVAIVTGVAAGLDFAHRRGIMHRDIKPANILVTPGDDPVVPEAVKLTDFGIAQALDEVSALTGTGTTIGTLRYSSPEQIEGKRVDARSDTYSLGATAYELLTGSGPFESTSLHGLMTAHMFHDAPPATSRNPTLPPAVDAVLHKAMAKGPDARYQRASDFAADLANAFDNRNTLVGPVPAPSAGVSGPHIRPGGESTGPNYSTHHQNVAPGTDPRWVSGRMSTTGAGVAAPPMLTGMPASAWSVRRVVVVGAIIVLAAAFVGVAGAFASRSATRLATPDRPDATLTTSAIELAWNRVDGASSYVVKQNDVEIYAGGDNHFQAPLPLPGVYAYTVAARSDSAPGSDFSLRSDEVKVFLTWRGLQPVADLYPDLIPASPLSTNGFDAMSCSGDGGNLAFDTSETSIMCHKRSPDNARRDLYLVRVLAFSDVKETDDSLAMITRKLRGEPYTTAQGTAVTRFLDDEQDGGGRVIVKFAPGPRERTYLYVTVPGGSARDAVAVLARLPI